MGAVMALILVPAGADLPIAPPPRVAALYFPTTVGTKWVYEGTGGPEVHEVTAVEVKDGRKIVSVTWELDLASGKTKAVDRFHVSSVGVFKLGVNEKVYDPPQCVLQLPHVPGQDWKWQPKGDDKDTWSYTAAGVEEVEVPAGKFEAIRVEQVMTLGKYSLKTISWYAKGVGVVKREWETKPVAASGTVTLKSFTLGKGEKP